MIDMILPSICLLAGVLIGAGLVIVISALIAGGQADERMGEK